MTPDQIGALIMDSAVGGVIAVLTALLVWQWRECDELERELELNYSKKFEFHPRWTDATLHICMAEQRHELERVLKENAILKAVNERIAQQAIEELL